MRARAIVALLAVAWGMSSPAPAHAQGFSSGSTGVDGALIVTAPGAMANRRSQHTATLLSNGKVLVAGGWAPGSLSGAELYDPTTGLFASTGGMSTRRHSHAATLLPDGRVLVTGGHDDAQYLNTAEIYDPVTGTFAVTGAMTARHGYHTATLLADGKVLVAGGISIGGSGATAISELYDPATGQFAATGPLTTPRAEHTATLLASGAVLLAGGSDVALLSSAELYDPATRTFRPTAGPMATARQTHTATRLQNGKVLIASGYITGGATTVAAEIYDPTTDLFVRTPSDLTSGRYGHSAVLLANGKVLIASGYSNGVYLTTAELYDPIKGSFVPTGGLAVDRRYRATATLLSNGRAVLIGGETTGGSQVMSAEEYEPIVEAFNTRLFDPRAVSPPLDTDGDNVYHFTSIFVSPNMTLRLSGKVLNGPVHWLASGDVRIDGTIDLNGRIGHATTSSPIERVPSEPGAGGYSGGLGGNASAPQAQSGSGPLGGAVGASGGFGGNDALVPLVGGSGGGGYNRPANEPGSLGAGGGAGGGALLIASSTSIVVNGTISARGGDGRDWACGSPGSGPGAGGAIRLVAPAIVGPTSANLTAEAGTMGNTTCQGPTFHGRVRLEAMTQGFTGSLTGNVSRGFPLATFVPTTPPPQVAVARVAGMTVPLSPIGSFEVADVTINAAGPTTVDIEARQVPPGAIVKLYLSSPGANDAIVECPPLQGNLSLSTTTASVTFPPGFTRGYARATWQ